MRSLGINSKSWQLLFIGIMLFFLPALSFISTNLGQPALSISGIFYFTLLTILFVLFSSVILFLCIRLFFAIDFGVVFLSLVLIIYLYDNFIHISHLGRMMHVSVILVLSTCVFLLLSSSLTKYFFRFLFIFVLISYASLGISLLTKFDFSKNSDDKKHNVMFKLRPESSALTGFKRRNIYYVILDYHGSPEVLKRYGYDNDNFLKKMHEMNYYLASRARASYNMTYLTIRSIFDMGYSVKQQNTYKNLDKMFPSMFKNNGRPALLSYLDKIRYDFYWAGNKWARCTLETKKCISRENKHEHTIINYVYEKPIENQMYSMTSYLPSLFGLKRYSHDEGGIDGALEYLRKQGVPKKNSFIFIHDLTAHPGAICDPLEKSMEPSLLKANVKNSPLHMKHALCADKKAMNLANYLKLADPDAIVIFQADHGPAFLKQFDLSISALTKRQIEERISILNLIKVPQICTPLLREDIGTINTLKLALQCAIGVRPTLDMDKSYWGFYEKHPEFGKVFQIS